LTRSLRISATTKFAAGSLALTLSLTGLITTSIHQAVAQKAAPSGKAKLGETVFKTNCIQCHNKQPGDTTPFGPPNLHGIIGTNTSTTPPQVTPQVAMETIRKGKGIMPPFEGKLSPADISNVVAYLKTQ
jgi:mono/diheme cytochrome c family protein